EKVISALEQLADPKLQRRLWLATAGPEISSPIEAVEALFDDSGLGDALERERVPAGLDCATVAVLRELDRAIEHVDLAVRPEAPLADPRMDYVRALAGRALKLMKAR